MASTPNRPLLRAPALAALLLLPALALGQSGGEDALVKRLADIGARWVQLTEKQDASGLSDAERDQRQKIEERVLAIATELLGEDAREVDNSVIDELLLEALERHRPAAAEVFRARYTAAPAKELEGKLLSLYAALTMYTVHDGTVPTQSEGLAALLADGSITPAELTDPWGRPFRYEVLGEDWEFRVTSNGPDGVAGTPDDVWVGTEGEIGGVLPDPYAEPPPAMEGFGTLPASNDLWALALTEDGRGLAYIAEREDGLHVGWSGGEPGERGPFDKASLIHCGAIPGAAVFRAQRGESTFLVTPQGTRPAGAVLAAAFVHGTTDLVLVEEIDGRIRGEVAGRPISLDGPPDPGEAAPLVTDSQGRMVAWREHLSDGRWVVHTSTITSKPALWASDPVVLPLADGDVVAFRMWHGDSTSLVIGGEAWAVAWARDPVVSPDGERILVPFCNDGAPLPEFEAAREQQTLERLEWGYVATPAFSSTTFNLLDDGKLAGANARWVGDPVFTPDGASWAYRVQGEDGRWSVHRRMPEGLHAGPRFDEVGRPGWDVTGTRVLHRSRNGEGELFTCNARFTHAPWSAFVRSSESGHAWISPDGEGARVTVTSPDLSEVTSFKRYDEIDNLRWGPDGSGPVARVRQGDQRRIWAADIEGRAYPHVYPPVLATGGRAGYVVRTSEEGYAVVVYRAEEAVENVITGNDGGDEFNVVGAPVAGPDGTVAFVTALDGYVFPLFQDDLPGPSSGPVRVLFFGRDDWRKGPEVDAAQRLQVGADGQISYVAEVDGRYVIHVLEEGDLSESEAYASVEDFGLRPDGQPYALVTSASGERFLLKGTTPGPGGISFLQTAESPDGATLAYRMLHDDARERVHLDTATVPLPADVQPYGPFLWSPDSRHLLFRATRGELMGDVGIRGPELLVLVDRDDPAAPLTVEADDLSYPRLTPDGTSVEFVAVRDNVPTHVVLPLDGE